MNYLDTRLGNLSRTGPYVQSLGQFNTLAELTAGHPANNYLPGTMAYCVDAGQMISDGSQWLNLGTTIPGEVELKVATYAKARQVSGVTTGDILYVLGRTSQSDGGQGLFVWVAGGSTAINDGFELTAAGGIWRRPGVFTLIAQMLGLASFTFATLPTALQMLNMPSGITAYTTDQGLCLWNGMTWSRITAAGPNPVGINFATGGGVALSYEGFPIFKNRVREGRGFCGTTPNVNDDVQVALSAAGWPAADFSCYLYEGNIRQSWLTPQYPANPPSVSGMLACGFLTTTGTETITGLNGGVIANIVRGGIGTYTTFNWWSNLAGGFIVTGTSGTTANVFAFLPAYRSYAPIAGTSGPIDDPTTAAAFTLEAILHYSQYAHLRVMKFGGNSTNIQVSTSVTRRTAANTQSYPGHPIQGGVSVSFTAPPGNASTSATLTANWPFPTGSYGLPIHSPTNIDGRICTCTNGSTAVTWTPALGEASDFAGLGVLTREGFPIDWMIALCNACNIGIWICTPMLEDGTNSSAGSWSSALMDYLVTHWTSSGKIYFEIANEIWNFGQPIASVNTGLAAVYGFSDQAHYLAYLLHAMANLCRTKFPTKFGTQVNLVFAWRMFSPGITGVTNVLSALAALGTPSADIQYVAGAPYVVPTVGNTDSIATIETATATASVIRSLQANSESIVIAALKYGIKYCTYEGGGQWDQVNNNNANVGLAIMDAGMTAPLTTLFQGNFNSGAAFITHFGAGVAGVSGNTSPTYELSTLYASPLSSPTLSALQSFMAGSTPTRNVVNGAGAVISGINYEDNSAALVNSPGNFTLFMPPYYSVFGYLGYLINCTAPGAYTLTVNFTVSSGTPTTDLEVNGEIVSTGTSVVTGNVSLGNVTLNQGVNYVLLGKSGSQAGVAVNSLTFT